MLTHMHAQNRGAHIKTWRLILEALKDFLIQTVNLEFTPRGVQLLAMDEGSVAMAHLFLEVRGFDVYECSETRSIGLRILDLLKAIKAMSSVDEISFDIPVGGELELVITGKEHKKETKIEFHLRSLDVDRRRYLVPRADWRRTIQIPTKDFKTYISTLAGMGADDLVVEWRDKVLSFLAEEDNKRCRISISTVEKDVPAAPESEPAPPDVSTTPSGIPVAGAGLLGVPSVPQIEPLYATAGAQKRSLSEAEEPAAKRPVPLLPEPHSPPIVTPDDLPSINARFPMKYLTWFTKAEQLNTVVRVLLKRRFPLCLTYEIIEWGELTFCVNPAADDDDVGDEEVDEDAYDDFDL
jgi:hypothetical protein